MKQLWFLTLVVLAVIGVAFNFCLRGKGLEDGQAGRAFLQGEDGELVEQDGDRSNGRTEVGQARDEEGLLTGFSLTERSGKQISSEDLKGQPYVAGFFFSMCPSICVQQNTKVQQLQERFKDQPIRFLSISCDPEIDTPEVLTKYADRFEADPDQWLFFTGDMTYIRNVGFDRFRLGVMRRGHPEKFALMDANDEMVGLYTWSDEGQWKTLQTDIEKLIASGGTMPKQEVSEAESP